MVVVVGRKAPVKSKVGRLLTVLFPLDDTLVVTLRAQSSDGPSVGRCAAVGTLVAQ